jgi:hypothetical protein
MKYLFYEDEERLRKLLASVCKTVTAWDDKEYSKYDQGWNDERVAHTLGISLQAVKRIRAKLYGSSRIPTKPQPVVARTPRGNGMYVPVSAPPPSLPRPHVDVAIGQSELGQKLIQRVARLEEQVLEQKKQLEEILEFFTKNYAKPGVGHGSPHRLE